MSGTQCVGGKVRKTEEIEMTTFKTESEVNDWIEYMKMKDKE